jgi:hypothetical protein
VGGVRAAAEHRVTSRVPCDPQLLLMDAAWPDEILGHPDAEVVYVSPM